MRANAFCKPDGARNGYVLREALIKKNPAADGVGNGPGEFSHGPIWVGQFAEVRLSPGVGHGQTVRQLEGRRLRYPSNGLAPFEEVYKELRQMLGAPFIF
jgi:hypothetical protein